MSADKKFDLLDKKFDILFVIFMVMAIVAFGTSMWASSAHRSMRYDVKALRDDVKQNHKIYGKHFRANDKRIKRLEKDLGALKRQLIDYQVWGKPPRARVDDRLEGNE